MAESDDGLPVSALTSAEDRARHGAKPACDNHSRAGSNFHIWQQLESHHYGLLGGEWRDSSSSFLLGLQAHLFSMIFLGF